jgi:hypothetical protein
MIECGERVRFLPQPYHPMVVSSRVHLDWQDFECDIPVQREIAGPIDFSHPATADQLDDSEVEKRVARRPSFAGDHRATVEQGVWHLVNAQHPLDGCPERVVLTARGVQQASAIGAV